jgi:type I restriction-modification system DNA methylase subunit
MARILKPAPGMSVYDPTCGSGGMLIISREYIEQSGGDPTNLRPEHVEKIVSTFDRYEDAPAYARVVSFAETASAAG